MPEAFSMGFLLGAFSMLGFSMLEILFSALAILFSVVATLSSMFFGFDAFWEEGAGDSPASIRQRKDSGSSQPIEWRSGALRCDGGQCFSEQQI